MKRIFHFKGQFGHGDVFLMFNERGSNILSYEFFHYSSHLI
jgi:hypothetical protein